MRLDFFNIVKTCAQDLKYEHKIVKEKDDIIIIEFKNFKIGAYYSVYEYELGFNYFNLDKNFILDIDYALIFAGCHKSKLPKFVFMSNETIMTNYIQAYFQLINEYYFSLSNINKR